MAYLQRGDRVVVRSDLEANTSYAMRDANGDFLGLLTIDATSDMCRFRGKTVTIDCVCGNGYYFIKQDNHAWYWSDGMFEEHPKPLEVDPEAWDSFFSDFSAKGAV